MILIDSSVWIDSLSAKPSISKALFSDYVINGEAVTIRPIINEVLSHPNPKMLPLLKTSFNSLEKIDLNWNHEETWESLYEIAIFARKRKLSPAGVVDRMVLLSAQNAGCILWTLDRKVLNLGRKLGIQLI